MSEMEASDQVVDTSDNIEEVSPEVGEASEQSDAPSEKVKEETQKLIKKLKLKVDGEEIEEEIDLNDEARLIKELQLARAAKKRMQEAQDAKRQAFDLVSQFDKDPATLLKRLGPKGREIAEQVLLEQLQLDSMPPEQRRLMELEQELSRYKQQEELTKKQQEEEKMAQLEAQQAEILQNKIIDGLKKAQAPTTPEAVKRMASIYLKNMELGLELDPYDLAEEYKKEVQGYLSNTFKDASIEQLIAMFGPDVIKKLRQHDVKQMNEKNKMKASKISADMRVPNPPSKERQYETTEEWLERMRRQNKGN